MKPVSPKRSSNLQGHSNKVIPFQQTADYFHERGLEYLRRNDLHRALRAFQRTVEADPNNPANHCNVAGILAELGQFTDSIAVLEKVLQEVDPDMSECYFYLANNYAHLGQYDLAEEYILRYLDVCPDGEYVLEAEEMLDLLLEEFGGGQAYSRYEAEQEEQERAAALRDGRHLLEQGKFEEAVEWLERMIVKEPENIAARNNLSLAYFYTGQTEKALKMAEEVLTQQPDNLHALCNYGVYIKQQWGQEAAVEYFSKFEPVFPLNYDLAMKLATTYGLVGMHVQAMRCFLTIARFTIDPDVILIHSIAAAAANAGYFATAKRWWTKLSKDEKMYQMAEYYLRVLSEAEQEGYKKVNISYQYDIPVQLQYVEMRRRLNEMDVETWRDDPIFRASLQWGLIHGNQQTKFSILFALSQIGDDVAEKMVRQFLREQDVEEELRIYSLLLLKHISKVNFVEIRHNHQLQRLSLTDVQEDIILQVNRYYQEVWSLAELWLFRQGYQNIHGLVKKTWLKYLYLRLPEDDKKIGKIGIWAGGLLYLVLRYEGISVTLRELSEAFEVSSTSIRKASQRIEQLLLQNVQKE